ncbi:MAG: class I SAM-dependent methyltransferase [Planctomycetota bacterium]|nr:class I SAM-dependent methyltransferase [Planctomycetota bacterium]
MSKSKKQKHKLSAKNADKHLLYQWSVQTPEFETEFMARAFAKRNDRAPRVLREDFCGTALNAATWVRGRPERRAIALDLDRATLEWGRLHNLEPLGPDARRVELLQQDVRSLTRPKADICCALNFSYYFFSTIRELADYLEMVHGSLNPGGVMIMDCYGGWESQQIKEEPRKVKGPRGRFTYVWDQADYNPVDNMALCYIHFRFNDGSEMPKAFSYHWRLYTPPEVRDALELAGFRDVQIYWDVETDEDESDYRPRKRAENCPGWLAYIVGYR